MCILAFLLLDLLKAIFFKSLWWASPPEKAKFKKFLGKLKRRNINFYPPMHPEKKVVHPVSQLLKLS